MATLDIIKTKNPKEKPDEGSLGFGKIFTDHMFVMDYSRDKGWHEGKVVPYGPIAFDPSSMVFHYGQEMYEGLKAYRGEKDGIIRLFRPEKSAQRMNSEACDRVCIPRLPEEIFMEAVKTLVEVDRDWVPSYPRTSLYIRPMILSTEAVLGVRTSDTFKFVIILSPVGPYYNQGLSPIRIRVEENYVRAVQGGIGIAKTGGNYAATMKAQAEAKEKGYDDILWLDAIDRKYVEEMGTSNVFFRIDDEVITPPLDGSVFPGVTRDSVIELLKSWGIKITERKLSIQEIAEAHTSGRFHEMFSTGTGSIISPVGYLRWGNHKMILDDGEVGELARRLYKEITGIRKGTIKDEFGWTVNL